MRTLTAQPLASTVPVGSIVQYRAYSGRSVVLRKAHVVGHPASNRFALEVRPVSWPADATPTFICTAGVKVVG